MLPRLKRCSSELLLRTAHLCCLDVPGIILHLWAPPLQEVPCYNASNAVYNTIKIRNGIMFDASIMNVWAQPLAEAQCYSMWNSMIHSKYAMDFYPGLPHIHCIYIHSTLYNLTLTDTISLFPGCLGTRRTDTSKQLHVLNLYTPSRSHFDQSHPSGSEVLTGSAAPPYQLIGGNNNVKDIHDFREH